MVNDGRYIYPFLYESPGAPFTVWGTGSPLRQFLYNIDFGKLMVGSIPKAYFNQ